MKMICVYCGSRDGDDPAFARAADAVGAGIAGRGMGLVYGAGDVGLMGRVAAAALRAGGPVVGVIPHHLRSHEVERRDLTELIAVDTMHERKMTMFRRADAFIALPGGPGTLDELIELLTWRQLGLHEKPAHLLNLGGYWDPLLTLLRTTVERGFASAGFLDFLTSHGTVDSLLDAL
ncbi:TIGR00730 family Rossman fold protein [Pikeienuella piscinae]|uniref:Cytokinin riboside 5'-monophosphate phosphoribohydrolase n=1 Tax=Pikeienuella piscinae TaxID=2748098 RepID=A0A7L5BTU5_9RHOB|nr:TIGR00730 family Rossman fold protein [Pikeienuella piscinae]QIE54541.1 TIGR00730 family Rossman fold protein [Pikeienuella piscinae]